MKQFEVTQSSTLIKSIQKEIKELNFNQISACLRKKDVKVNGKRVNKDVALNAGDVVQVYYNAETPKVDRVYEDENILIVSKPTKVEVIGNDDDLVHRLAREGVVATPCHRIDVNTAGLVIFAKNAEAEKIVLQAFKDKTLKKYYLAWVDGKFTKPADTLTAYLTKDADNATVKVHKSQLPNSKQIITNYEVVEEFNSSSLLKVEIPTGRTHQIRAHLAFVGHPIIGDEKYGNKAVNKKFSLKMQCLTAVKLVLNFGEGNLSYLNGKQFETTCAWLNHTQKDKS